MSEQTMKGAVDRNAKGMTRAPARSAGEETVSQIKLKEALEALKQEKPKEPWQLERRYQNAIQAVEKIIRDLSVR